ncbi:hypothetical protein FRB95_005264 [Tulasnella sp. JGI-2019a]|nr:hypothetical protein FRB95_005264 [Tulasnella sp. JGI-2019a]
MAYYTMFVSTVAIVLLSLVAAAVIPVNDLPKLRLEVQGHRGGVGLRPEETLWAFAYGMEVGLDVLEMDMVFTKDEVPVLWHDHYIDASKCADTSGNFVGKFIANLTLAEVKTLDCGSRQLPGMPQQEVHPGATIATLEEVLNLVDCYGDKAVRINLETKLSPLRPNETLSIDTYINSPRFLPFLEKRGYLNRVTIESFDWRTLVRIKEKWGKKVTTVALIRDTTMIKVDGVYPWLGGTNLDDFNGSYIAAAHSIHASVISPVSGLNGTVNDPSYVPFTTKATVEEAHKLGMKMLPWTVDDESSISAMLTLGVDGIISNYPERVLWVARQRGMIAGKTRMTSRPECLQNASMPRSQLNPSSTPVLMTNP